jgi:hypothetical protein
LIVGRIEAKTTGNLFMRRKPPEIPSELQTQFGEVEYAFGPNVRIRGAATLLGLIFTGIGVLILMLKVAGGMPGGWGETKYLVVMLVFGVAIIFGSRTMPMNWVFVCDRGIVRTRGSAWDGVDWGSIERFEDASMTHKGLAIRQCRIVLKDGSEWGFIADNIAEYSRLGAMLKHKTDTNNA